MNEEDWRELLQQVQEELRAIGREDIGELDSYEVREGAERYLPDAKSLVKQLLDALHRDMATRSPSTLQESLTRLGELIDEGERPAEVVVWVDRERSVIEARERQEPLKGDDGAPQALNDLEELIGQLGEIPYEGDDFR